MKKEEKRKKSKRGESRGGEVNRGERREEREIEENRGISAHSYTQVPLLVIGVRAYVVGNDAAVPLLPPPVRA